MIDSGATGLFIHQRFIDMHRVMIHPLARAIPLHNIDGSRNQAGSITHYARLELSIGTHTERTEFLVTNIRPEDMILGLQAPLAAEDQPAD